MCAITIYWTGILEHFTANTFRNCFDFYAISYNALCVCVYVSMREKEREFQNEKNIIISVQTTIDLFICIGKNDRG
jgi:hypothetical protein